MEKITISAGCENGHSSKQAELFRAIYDKVKELYPDIKTTGSSTGGWSRSKAENDEVCLTWSVDSSD